MGLGLGLRGRFDRMKFELNTGIANVFAKPNKNIRAAYLEPSDMLEPERIMLYALIRGLRPQSVLEVGVRWGGGARIIAAALEDSGSGHAVGIDPEPKAFRPSQKELFNRYELMVGYSPDDIPQAVAKLGGKIDFVLIDAIHTYDNVLTDFKAVLPHLAKSAHVLFHDAYHAGINAAIQEILENNASLVDCGFISRHAYITDAPVGYCGLRLLRYGATESDRIIKQTFREAGRTADLSPSLYNWDSFKTNYQLP